MQTSDKISSDGIPTWLKVTIGVFIVLFFVGGSRALGETFIGNIGVAIAAAATGVLLSFVMFLKSDDDMRGLKTLLLGALSGTGLAKSDQIARGIRDWYASLAPDHPKRQLAQLFFFALSSGLAGVLGGFLALRLGLEGMFVERQTALEKLLRKVPKVPFGAAPELDEFWPKLKGNLPDDKSIDALAKIEDWSAQSLDDALRAGAVFIVKERWADALRALEPFVLSNETPSPMAFDLYACALVGKNDWKPFDAETARIVDRLGSRMLTYWAESFLVNLDVGYLYLYVPGKADLAVHYSERAAKVRPESRAAAINLASALAQKHGSSASEEDVKKIIELLRRLNPTRPLDPGDFNKEGDFNEILKNPSFKAALSSS